MALDNFYHNLPKVELHAHLNGSLSSATLLQLKRFHADSGILDKTNAFIDEFFVSAGDTRSLSDCFQVFGIAHALTSVPEAVGLATALTLKEFEEDGCCYVELRSTPRQTENMSRTQYVDAIIKSIERSISTAKEITSLAIEYHNSYPDIVLGLELSGDPTIGKFQDFVPFLNQARAAGLKITLHCGEVANEQEILEMLDFQPERIGHGICIHPRLGGSDKTWQKLCDMKIPVAVPADANLPGKALSDMPTATPPTGSNCVLI
ncbi:Adenosine deaminase-like protein [Eumeta japonica]|uniref:Adenosine deaminase-like protein n=1 Tax=Eumeta variegata TaxID=151549 RepID=A0A4C1SMY2_EUMVA|nr:Adenosine deaminase-like protein [Eumeta japonica]